MPQFFTIACPPSPVLCWCLHPLLAHLHLCYVVVYCVFFLFFSIGTKISLVCFVFVTYGLSCHYAMYTFCWKLTTLLGLFGTPQLFNAWGIVPPSLGPWCDTLQQSAQLWNSQSPDLGLPDHLKFFQGHFVFKKILEGRGVWQHNRSWIVYISLHNFSKIKQICTLFCSYTLFIFYSWMFNIG